MDLDATRRETQLIAQSLGLAEQFRLTGIEIGFDVNRRDPTEHYVTVAGPTLSIELPIFDQKQAQIARLQAEYRQGVDRLTAMAVDIRSQVRAARDRLSASRETARLYRDTIIPQRQQVAKLSELHYNVMLLGVDRWLMARQAEVSAYKEYIEAVRDYWIARSDLEWAVEGRARVEIRNPNDEIRMKSNDEFASWHPSSRISRRVSRSRTIPVLQSIEAMSTPG